MLAASLKDSERVPGSSQAAWVGRRNIGLFASSISWKVFMIIETQTTFRTHFNIHRKKLISNWPQIDFKVGGELQKHTSSSKTEINQRIHHCQQEPRTRLTKLVRLYAKTPRLSARKHASSLDISGGFWKLECSLWATKRLMIWRTPFDKKLRRFPLKRCAKCERASKIVSKLAWTVTELASQKSSSKPRNQNALYWTIILQKMKILTPSVWFLIYVFIFYFTWGAFNSEGKALHYCSPIQKRNKIVLNY